MASDLMACLLVRAFMASTLCSWSSPTSVGSGRYLVVASGLGGLLSGGGSGSGHREWLEMVEVEGG